MHSAGRFAGGVSPPPALRHTISGHISQLLGVVFSATADVSLNALRELVEGDMSDDEDFFDDEYWEYDDSPNDGVAAWADDLAEHAMYSPVWADMDPNFEMEEFWSDWENYSDDYYDGDTRKSTIEGNGIRNSPKSGDKRKRAISDGSRQKRLKREEGIPDLSMGDPLDASTVRVGAAPIVIWRAEESPEGPPLHDSEGVEKVSVLKDWRERLQEASHTDQEIEIPANFSMEGSKDTVKITSKVELGSAQAVTRKSARLGSRLPVGEIATGAIAGFNEENRVPRCGLGITSPPENAYNDAAKNPKVATATRNDPKTTHATTRTARIAGKAGQKRKAPELTEENSRTGKRKAPSSKRQPRSGVGGDTSGNRL
ncbi:hypothetical protein GP486_001468 [Trichoglossum hirsutum]|uniref:Uncharacterized protein n=1 Tax=Trichoglossum hirsutum TaxID=265104 RepID=A0A9P8LG10_9PEZI|nr:hypothetical protein GP486_001468 [Trichoglossum hirsutum]